MIIEASAVYSLGCDSASANGFEFNSWRKVPRVVSASVPCSTKFDWATMSGVTSVDILYLCLALALENGIDHEGFIGTAGASVGVRCEVGPEAISSRVLALYHAVDFLNFKVMSVSSGCTEDSTDEMS